ncbi:MAG: T9SS type A sorting domain-containing protein [Candidatus Latescibacteria bacterium]|nr:T9SS type A sorting domain-containing protein [Candidatus Latescibacterota bacterium]NIM22186.1 T9SS type A sorting domain-containing protein [Candidatus Latescibacterota bacterium]NIM64736.1 T9SS type A sorting domain-containing protein [Candidatus Latescibacterota bacterium]NIO01246.1 T9SS type A sorting domain-containing protein [Candidatus Latescibacterota bacterium]NIO27631.1 T9SS type A sorting domain-containing protein [Candidatus Latescibacterota bacterium]
MKRFRCIPLILFMFLICVFWTRVEAQPIPSPHDTLFVTASIPYEGQHGNGEAYVYLADSLGTLTNPVIAVEGFDLDNSWDWDELYNHLNKENMIETLRSEGYDIVMLNFTDATDYVQRNGYVVIELIQQVQSAIDTTATLVVAGASMGGLCARYALAYMETHGLEHRVRNFISFDAPHHGANVPLGVQYWLEFFSGLSDAAAEMLDRLNRPAARQMLVYHYTMPPGSTGEPDSLRAGLLADFSSIGEYPENLRKVAIANGSGYQLGQGFAPGDQIIQYEYSEPLTTIRGNVWAVPDSSEQMIFDGYIRIIIIPTTLSVTVSGTQPYDNAPGGWRASMADMDSTEAPYGDIIALHDNHCFIPTISALAIDTEDLFYDIAGDPDILSHTPFDTIYYPAANQDHASITAENAQWFITEVRVGATGVPSARGPLLPDVMLYQNYPNPFNPMTTISFTLPEKARVNLSIYNLEGKLIKVLIDGMQNEGYREITWDATGSRGNPAASGVYFYRLTAGNRTLTKKMVLLK